MSESVSSNTERKPSPEKATARSAILVLGMHRSGTSALTRMLSLLGAALPQNLMGPDVGNELGHWESNAIFALNDEVLASAGSQWNDWLPFDPSWRESENYAHFLARAQDVVRAEFGQSPLFLIKDPRICRLVPFWLDVIESLDIRPVIVLPQRNPIEVSASLSARDGSDFGAGLLLWLRHVLDAEAATRHLSRYFSSYEQLIEDWTQVADRFESATGIPLPNRSTSTAQEIANFLARDAKHQTDREGAALAGSTSAWVRETHTIMQHWCDSGEDSEDFVRLDAIRIAFDAAGSSFAQIAAKGLALGDGAGSAAVRLRDLDNARNEIAQLKEHLATSVQKSDTLRRLEQDLQALHVEFTATQVALAERDREGLRRQERIAELEIARNEQQEAIERIALARAAALDQATALREELSNAQSALLAERAQVRDLTDLADRMFADIERETERRRRAEASAYEAEAALSELNSDAEALRATLSEQVCRTQQEERDRVWLQKVYAAQEANPWWWRLMPRSWLRRRQHRSLAQHGLFDAADYLDRYPDVATRGMDPLRHYILYGLSEGREI